MTGSFGVFLEKNFFPNFFCWWQPSTPQPGPKRRLVGPRNPKGRPQGCNTQNWKNDILNLKMGFLTQNISADMGFRRFRWAGAV